jgi:hypothetical protein
MIRGGREMKGDSRENAGFITAQALFVDGGSSLGMI